MSLSDLATPLYNIEAVQELHIDMTLATPCFLFLSPNLATGELDKVIWEKTTRAFTGKLLYEVAKHKNYCVVYHPCSSWNSQGDILRKRMLFLILGQLCAGIHEEYKRLAFYMAIVQDHQVKGPREMLMEKLGPLCDELIGQGTHPFIIINNIGRLDGLVSESELDSL